MNYHYMRSLAILVFTLITVLSGDADAQVFSSVTPLSPLAVTKNTGEKPQSKVWEYKGSWYAVFPNSSGTFIWRLDGATWKSVLKISSNTTVKADCKPVNNLCHIFLWKKSDSPSQLISVEYVEATSSYKLWTVRPATVYIPLDAGTETGTIDIDSNNRMWLASDATSDIRVRWSDYPYTTWSAPLILASGTKDDDICVVVALPFQKQVGVFWSNQNTKRFGFRTHADGADPLTWSADENPAGQFALNVGYGFSDDHMNMKVAGDGTLYCASKTSYDTPGYPKLILLKRTPNGTWGSPYEVTQTGTRGIVLLNEQTRKLKYIYTSVEDGGDILCKESSTVNISFPTVPDTLIRGVYNNPTTSKHNFQNETVILASTLTQVVGVLATDVVQIQPPSPVALASPEQGSVTDPSTTVLLWQRSINADFYQLQVSNTPGFESPFIDTTLSDTTFNPSSLMPYSEYSWRVRAGNAAGYSGWSSAAFFTSGSAPATPVLVAPADMSEDVSTSASFSWSVSQYASFYEFEISQIDVDSSAISFITGQTSLVVDTLERNSGYTWRVRAGNTDGLSEWSAAFSFTTIPFLPAAPLLISPVNESGEVEPNVTMAWTTSDSNVSFHLQISDSFDFTHIQVDQDNILADTLFVGLQYSSTYYWRVAASNSAGESQWSEVWSFSTKASMQQLVGYWKLNEGTGAQINDASGFGNNGIVQNNPLWTTGFSEGALRFNGINQLALIPDATALDVHDGITVSAWIKPEKKASQHLVSKGEPGVIDGYELSLLSTGKVSFRVNQKTSGSLKLNSKTLYPSSGTTWMHIAATYDGATMKIFINGVEDKTTTFPVVTPINTNDRPLALAGEPDMTSLFKGVLDEVRIYNYVLSPAEISTLLQSQTPAFGRSAVSATASASMDIVMAEPAISIYPNPGVSKITIASQATLNKPVIVTITDFYGRIIKKETTTSTLVEYDTDDLRMSAGFYLIRITDGAYTKTLKFQKK